MHGIIEEFGLEAVDLLKIDVEGAEVQVLEGVHDADWAVVRQAVIEVHSAELLVQVEGILKRRFSRVSVLQDKHMQGSELFIVYASRGGDGSDQQ